MKRAANCKGIADPFAGISAEQILLLKAALLPGESAISAWRQWSGRTATPGLDLASRRLLPLAYFNLNALGESDPLLKKCKGVMRLVWTQNQMRLAKAKRILRALQQAGIPVMLLKGAALVASHYPHRGLRAMGDVDLLVPRDMASTAVALMQAAGWKPKHVPGEELTEDFFSVYHAISFEDETGEMLDLHWHLMEECVWAGADDDFWEEAREVSLDDLRVQVLNPTDQILHLCSHAARHALERTGLHAIGWAADVMTIWNARNAEIDFPRLLLQARKRRLELSLRQALFFLQLRLAAGLPSAFLTELEEAPLSDLELRESRVRPKHKRASGYFQARWCQYVRRRELASSAFRLSELPDFLEFLRCYYRLRLRGQLPLALASRALKKLAQLMSKPTP